MNFTPDKWRAEIYTRNPLFPNIGTPYLCENTEHESEASAIQHADAAFAVNATHVFVWALQGGSSAHLIFKRFAR